MYSIHHKHKDQLDSEFMKTSFLPKCINQKLQGFLPYQTNKDPSQKDCLHSPKNHQKEDYDPCLFGRAKILVILG